LREHKLREKLKSFVVQIRTARCVVEVDADAVPEVEEHSRRDAKVFRRLLDACLRQSLRSAAELNEKIIIK